MSSCLPRALSLSMLLSLALLGCETTPRNDGPYFFAERVEEAGKSFDEESFLSFRKDGRLAAAMTLGTETQLSLTPFLPSRLTFTVAVPPDPLLQFSIGVSTLGGRVLPAPVRFLLHVDAGSGEVLTFEDTVRRARPNEWLYREVDLSPWAGQQVRLTFENAHPRRRGRAHANRLPTGQAFIPVWGNPVLAGKSTHGDRPHLVLISIDCLRADHVSAYGYGRNTTPSIDALARDGVVFEKAASVSSWTLPTHMSMLTGLMPSHHGASRSHKLSASVPFLPEMLSRAGYETLGVVSGAYLSPAFGFDRGFHIYRYLNDRAAAEVVDAALELSRRAGGRSQFLFVHFFDPHWPYLPPRDFLERFGKRPPDISDLTRMVVERIPPGAPEEVEYLKNLYDGEVAYVDQHLGRLIQALQAAGLYDESLIVLTADHGEAFYEHELWQHSELLYEEVTHIPLVVKWPKGRHQGSVSRLVSQLNIFSTILEEAGLDFSYPDTPSLSRHVENGGEIAGPSMVLGEITWEPNPTRGALMKISLRTEELKYIATFAGEIGDEKFVSELLREELYDLSRDPLERENLLPQALGKIGLLRREVRRFLDEARRSKAAQQGQKIVLDEELIEQLKALGYLNP